MRTEVVAGTATSELRRAVLRPHWPVGSAMHGDGDPAAVHVAALDDDDSVIGCCLLLERAYPPRPEAAGAWQLRGMATDPGGQGQGIGTAVLDRAVAEVADRGGQLLWCDARTTAVGFYARHGFTAEGAEFVQTETGLPHFHMWRTSDLPAAP